MIVFRPFLSLAWLNPERERERERREEREKRQSNPTGGSKGRNERGGRRRRRRRRCCKKYGGERTNRQTDEQVRPGSEGGPHVRGKSDRPHTVEGRREGIVYVGKLQVPSPIWLQSELAQSIRPSARLLNYNSYTYKAHIRTYMRVAGRRCMFNRFPPDFKIQSIRRLPKRENE